MSTSVTENGVTREVGMYACVDGVMRMMSLDTSDATATAADISKGKTAYCSSGKITGTGKVLEYLITGVSNSLLYDGGEIPTPSMANIIRGGGGDGRCIGAFANDSMLLILDGYGFTAANLTITNDKVIVPATEISKSQPFYYCIGKDKAL